jgi:hypothetical protein
VLPPVGQREGEKVSISIVLVAALVALLLAKKKSADTTGGDAGENEETYVPIWEQTTLAGTRAVTFAKEGLTFIPMKVMFGFAGVLEQLGWQVPEFALKGKKIPPGGKLCAIIIEPGAGNAILSHGSMIESLKELCRDWSKAGAVGEQVDGCDVITNPDGDASTAGYVVRKGDGQYGTLWVERCN